VAQIFQRRGRPISAKLQPAQMSVGTMQGKRLHQFSGTKLFVGNLCTYNVHNNLHTMYIIELISNLYGTKDNVPMNAFKDYSVSMCVYSFGRN
jgi:hypothetical protein